METTAPRSLSSALICKGDAWLRNLQPWRTDYNAERPLFAPRMELILPIVRAISRLRVSQEPSVIFPSMQ